MGTGFQKYSSLLWSRLYSTVGNSLCFSLKYFPWISFPCLFSHLVPIDKKNNLWQLWCLPMKYTGNHCVRSKVASEDEHPILGDLFQLLHPHWHTPSDEVNHSQVLVSSSKKEGLKRSRHLAWQLRCYLTCSLSTPQWLSSSPSPAPNSSFLPMQMLGRGRWWLKYFKCSPTWDTWVEFLVPSLCLIPSQPLWVCEN